MSLMVGFPLYHQVPVTWFTRWQRMDRTAVTGETIVNGAYITTSMDMIVSGALEHDGWDRLVIFEHDMIPPLDAFTRIAHYSPDHAIVGSMYFRHEPPHNALVYIEDDTLAYNPITPQTVRDWCDEPALYECDAVGFGFTSIARRVLEDWDIDVPMFSLDNTFGSHDLWFCHYARQQGHRVYVDSGICCDHLTQVPIGYADNQKMADTIDYDLIVPFSYEAATSR